MKSKGKDKIEMLNRITWKEFRNSGALWFANRILHLFGLALVMDINKKSGEIKNVYPAKCKFRGFEYKCEERGFYRTTLYLKRNANKLLKDCLIKGEKK